MTSLEDLSDDILFVILEYLFSDRLSHLQRLRLTSWRLKDFAESQIYKTVVVGDEEHHVDYTNRFMDRLLDPNDKLSRHVRNFSVTSYEGDDASYCFNSSMFVRLLEKFQGFDNFSWNTDTPMPHVVLNAFHTRWPRSKLHARTKTFDPVILRSSQLYRLNISVGYSNLYPGETFSFMRRLKDALLKCVSLRVFMIRTHRDPFIRRAGLGDQDRGPLNLPLELGDKLPPIEELAVDSPDYDYSESHCDLLVECIDWSRIRRLSFGPWCPHALFGSLANHVAKLKSIEFGSCGQHGSYLNRFNQFNPHLFNCAARCLPFIEAMEELTIHCSMQSLSSLVWAQRIAPYHKSSLRYLSIRSGDDLLGSESLAALETLSRDFPYLQTLDLPITMAHGYSWPKGYKEALARLTLLRDLHISIRVPIRGYISLIACVEPHASPLISELWNCFQDHDPTNELETITIRFWRWEESLPLHTNLELSQKKRLTLKQMFYVGNAHDGEFGVKAYSNPKTAKRHSKRHDRSGFHSGWPSWWDSTAGNMTIP
ncbi:hypothetical protein CC78DRAFT_528248 [Lojkania enalia]|uniref:F-box domain-containing protein n=1 Tax=Lojkania enalia TaxID=147567 RepID=A0A9P4TRJ4_9PLEO|nr:hypothetical protein CC78DRAFT_528248 [Didymosphaeria enalia]